MDTKEIKTQLANIKELADKQETLSPLEVLLLNFCELLVEENTQLREDVQTLKDELNILKGEQGKPVVRKQTKGKGKNNDHSSEKNRKQKQGKSRKKRGSKKSKAKPDHTVKITMKPEELPSDAVYNGVKETLIQDINMTTNNTLFLRQKYFSSSENKYYLTPLPPGYDEGEYGPNIKSWSSVMYSASEITTKNITGIFNTAGVIISKSTVHQFIINTGMSLEEEKIEIAKAGMQATSYQHLDDTSARERGKNRYVNVIGNEFYSVYFTLAQKDRLSIIEMLSLNELAFAINKTAFDVMRRMNISDEIITALGEHTSLKYYTKKNINDILEIIFNGKKQKIMRKLILEATAIAAYRDKPYAIKQLIVDDAPQFKLITGSLGLCWIHEGRHYKKLNPIFKKHKNVTEKFIDQFWDYYHQLLAYKKKPTASLAKNLREKFRALFSTKTGYEKLDKQIETTLNKIEPLLLVLSYPDIPLHNNPAELMARWQARNRDIHLHTMSEKGTKAKDALATIMGTAKKLSVNAYHYLHDKITKTFEMTPLPKLIPIRASIKIDSG